MDIEQRIKELREDQESILEIIKNKDFTVDNVIYYGKELERISIRIDELDSLLWQSNVHTK